MIIVSKEIEPVSINGYNLLHGEMHLSQMLSEAEYKHGKF